MHQLAGHRAEAGQLHHQPLQRVVAGRAILRQQLAGLFGQIDQDRAGLEHRVGLSARAVLIDDHGHLGVRIQFQELGAELLVGENVHRVDLVGKAELFERDVDFHDVRAAHGIEIDHEFSPHYE